MKHIITLAAALLLTLTSSFAQTGKSIYRKYSGDENVSAVYISPAMFRLIGRVPDIEVEGSNVNLSSIIRSLSGLYIIDSENPKTNKSLEKEVNKFLDSGKYELLMEAKENGELTRMYTVGNDKYITSFVMVSCEEEETTFICLDGKMKREDLENLLAEQMDE